MQDSFSLYGIANIVFDGYIVGVTLKDKHIGRTCSTHLM